MGLLRVTGRDCRRARLPDSPRVSPTAPLCATILLLLFALIALPAGARTTDAERKMGREGAAEIAQHEKLLKDGPILARVEAVGKIVAAHTDEPDIHYTFHVIDSPDVNAFSLPAGYIYVYRGLVDHVHSDDELAGVLAHECAHAAHHHVLKLLHEQNKMTLPTLGALLATILTHSPAAGNLAYGVEMIGQARMSGFSVKYEEEADHYGLLYLLHTPYNPVGMLTFMERLARKENRNGQANIDWGIYRTHPPSAERAAALKAELIAHGISINRRAVEGSMAVAVRSAATGTPPAAEVTLGGKTLITVGPDGALSALERANAIADRLRSALYSNVTFRDVGMGADGQSVVVGKDTVYRPVSADAQLAGKPAQAVAQNVQQALRGALQNEFLHHIF